MKIYILIYTSLVILTHLYSATPTYNWTKLNNAIIFEKLETIVLQSSQWIFVSNINLTTYTEEIQLATRLVNETKTQCKLLTKFNNENELCDSIVLQLETELDRIYNENEFIISDDINPHKKRRAADTIAKILYGSINKETAYNYFTDISSLAGASNKIKQITFLGNILEDITKSIFGINKYENLLNDMKEEVNVLNKSFKSENIYSRIHFLFNELSDYILLILSKIQRDQHKLINIIFSAKKGSLHHYLFDSNRMFSEMVSAEITLQDEHFPYPLKRSNMYKILDLSQFNAIIHKNIIIFEVRTPLTKNQKFDVYNTIPIPTLTTERKFEIIVPEHQIFLINKKRTHYAPLPNYEIQIQKYCKTLENNRYICQFHMPMYIIQSRKTCEITLFLTAILDPEKCRKVPYRITDELWINLQDPSKYIYITKYPQSITINCKEHFETLQISDAGLIETECDIIANGIHISQSNKSRNEEHDNIIIFPEIKTLNSSNNTIKYSSELITNSKSNISINQEQNNLVLFILIIVIILIALLYIFATWLFIKGLKARQRTTAPNEST